MVGLAHSAGVGCCQGPALHPLLGAVIQGPLERAFRPSEIPKQVRITVLHEIAHHFGINDARLHELGYD